MSTSEQPEPTFFVDADLSCRSFNETLADAGISIEPHDEHFREGTEDEEWLTEVGERGWVVLSHNKKIRKTSSQTERLMRASVRAFMLIGDPHPNPPGQRYHFIEGLARNFVRTYPQVLRFLQRHDEGPWIAKIYRPSDFFTSETPSPGGIRMWLSFQKWLKEL